MIIFYTVPEIWSAMDVTFIFHFGLFYDDVRFLRYGARRNDGRSENCNIEMDAPTWKMYKYNTKEKKKDK